ncbi:hypothetical protein LJR118_001057 [Acidovorax sp. LjRoot118]
MPFDSTLPLAAAALPAGPAGQTPFPMYRFSGRPLSAQARRT